MATGKPLDVLYCFRKCKLVSGYCLIWAIILEGRTAGAESVLECREISVRKRNEMLFRVC